MNNSEDERSGEINESSNEAIIRFINRPLTIGILAFTILCLRAPDALYNAHFWAEDGDVFWLDAYTHGITSLVTPYAGYLHTTQRLGAWLISFFPYTSQPLLFGIAGALIGAWTAITITTTLPNRTLGALIGLSLVLVRHDMGEIFLTLVNTQWIMACALPILIVSPPATSKRWRYNQLAFLSLSVLSGPFSVMLIPIWFLKCTPIPKLNRTIFPIDKTIGGIGYAGGIIQFFILLFNPGRNSFTPSFSQVPIIWLRTFSDTFGIDRSWPFSILIFIIILVTLLYPRYRMLRLLGLYLLTLILISTAFKFGSYDEGFLSKNYLGPRYFYIPAVILATITLSLFFEKKSYITYTLATALTIGMLIGSINGRFIRDSEFRGESPWPANAYKIGQEDLEVKSIPKYYPPIEIPAK